MVNKWCLSQEKLLMQHDLKNAGVPQSIFNVLRNRGYVTVNDIIEFLRPSLFEFHSPFLFKDMGRIVTRLQKALELQEKILVYGDYDVDGVSGTALIYKVLRSFGFNVVVHIPSREEGYGLHQDVIQKASDNQISLIITVDCGITAVEETELASRLDIDIIITDHHEPQEQLPSAFGILNPKVTDSGYPFKHLAGVGVAFKLVQALFSHFQYQDKKHSELQYLDLAALGTIADIVPLIGENRIIAKYGLKVMEKTVHTGIRAIIEECGLLDKRLKAGQISFIVAPRINAAGRMDTARLALNLLLEEDYADALDIAKELSKENYQRQLTERRILQEAENMLAQDELPAVIVLSSSHWHHGVIGIVASRLVERFRRPVFLICEEGETGKGSARGIPDYHVLQELEKQASYLLKFGGHKQAAGFSLPVTHIAPLKEALNHSFVESGLVYKEQYLIDAIVPISELNLGLHQELEQIGPFGAGNPAPVLMSSDLAVTKSLTMGKNAEHLKLYLQKDNLRLEALAFKKGNEIDQLKNIKNIDIIYCLEVNDYLGEEKIQAVLKDYRKASGDSLLEIACAEDEFQSDLSDKSINESDGNSPIDLERKLLVEAFKDIKNKVDKDNLLYWELFEDEQIQMHIVKIFEELGLIEWLGGTGPFLIRLHTDNRTDLNRSLRYRMLSESCS